MSRTEHTPYSKHSDEELTVLTLKGDSEAYTHLYMRYREQIMNYYISKISDVNFAEDLMQKSFLKAVMVLKSFDPSRSFKSWFYALAHNVMIDELRRMNSEKSKLANYKIHLDLLSTSESASPYPEFNNQTANPSAAESIEFLKASPLTEQQRKALELRYIQEQSFEQIAQALNIKATNARKIISRALKALRAQI